LEIAFKIVNLKTGEMKEAYQTVILQPENIWKSSDPSSLKVNGFTYEKLLKGKRADIAATEITEYFTKKRYPKRRSCVYLPKPFF
jgi:DNA polymerase-3 subunit epsilon/oligoribonuclease